MLSQKYFLFSEYTYSTVFYPYSTRIHTFPKTDRMLPYSTRILPVFTHFPKLTVFYRIHQERTRIHKNTSMWKSVSAIFIDSARIPQNTYRIPRRVGILQEFTQNTEAYRIPLKNTARNTQTIPYSSSYYLRARLLGRLLFLQQLHFRIRYQLVERGPSLSLALSRTSRRGRGGRRP